MPKYKVNAPFFLKGVYYMENETCITEKPLGDIYTKAPKKGPALVTPLSGEPQKAAPKQGG